MDNGNSKRKEKLKQIFEYGYKSVMIVKVITFFIWNCVGLMFYGVVVQEFLRHWLSGI